MPQMNKNYALLLCKYNSRYNKRKNLHEFYLWFFQPSSCQHSPQRFDLFDHHRNLSKNSLKKCMYLTRVFLPSGHSKESHVMWKQYLCKIHDNTVKSSSNSVGRVLRLIKLLWGWKDK